jgi:integrase
MPRLTKKLPSYRRHKRSGQAVVTLDGRDHYLGPFGSPASKAEYDRLIARWLAPGGARARAQARVAADPTVNELILAFWRRAEADYRRPDGTPAPELDSLRLALRPLRAGFGSLPARDFGPLKLQALQAQLVAAGLCRVTVNQRVKRVVRLFAWAESQELVPPGHHHGLKTVPGLRKGRSPARESRVVRPVPDADVDAVRPFLPRQLWAVVELQRLTGMRSGEALAMRTCDVDRSGAVWVYTPRWHKTAHRGKERTVFLGPRAQAVLAPWLRPDPAEFLFQPREAKAEHLAERRRRRTTPLTPSHRARSRKPDPARAPGDRYGSKAYYHAVTRSCARAGVPRWHPHQLRHSAATLFRKEFGLDVARTVLGHASPVVTEVYAERDVERAVGAVARVG